MKPVTKTERRVLQDGRINKYERPNLALLNVGKISKSEHLTRFFSENRRVSNIKKMDTSFPAYHERPGEKYISHSQNRHVVGKRGVPSRRQVLGLGVNRKVRKVSVFLYGYARMVIFWLTMAAFLVILLGSLGRLGCYGEMRLIGTQLFDRLIKKGQLLRLIQQKENGLLSTDQYDEAMSFLEFHERFGDIEGQVTGLNQKIAIVSKANELLRINHTNKETHLREFIQNNTIHIENQINQLDLKLGREIESIREDTSSVISGLNQSLLETLSHRPGSQEGVGEQIKEMIAQQTDFDQFRLAIREELSSLSEEVKLLDEAQDVLKGMVWSMNKRNEEILTFSLESSFVHSQSPELETLLGRVFRTKLEMQGYNQVDWAQSSMGGEVVSPRVNKYCETSKGNKSRSVVIRALASLQSRLAQLVAGSRPRVPLKVPIYNSECFEPGQIIKSSQQKTIGSCFFSEIGSSIDIKLSVPINVTAVGVDHVLFPLEYDNGETVPRRFSVRCLESSSFEEIQYGDFVYQYPQEGGEGLQVFQVSPSSFQCSRVRFTIQSTYGSRYFCLYKLRVYGETVRPESSSPGERQYLLVLLSRYLGITSRIVQTQLGVIYEMMVLGFGYFRDKLFVRGSGRVEEDSGQILVQDQRDGDDGLSEMQGDDQDQDQDQSVESMGVVSEYQDSRKSRDNRRKREIS
ncbi:transmembrane domain-containing protein [Cryptosporidium canis]|nr:transmembrane domain-containing protein [Cryptosporidium canis]